MHVWVKKWPSVLRDIELGIWISGFNDEYPHLYDFGLKVLRTPSISSSSNPKAKLFRLFLTLIHASNLQWHTSGSLKLWLEIVLGIFFEQLGMYLKKQNHKNNLPLSSICRDILRSSVFLGPLAKDPDRCLRRFATIL